MGLEGFVDWTDPIASELAEEGKDDMSSLAVGFVTWMCKRAPRGKLPSVLKC